MENCYFLHVMKWPREDDVDDERANERASVSLSVCLILGESSRLVANSNARPQASASRRAGETGEMVELALALSSRAE